MPWTPSSIRSNEKKKKKLHKQTASPSGRLFYCLMWRFPIDFWRSAVFTFTRHPVNFTRVIPAKAGIPSYGFYTAVRDSGLRRNDVPFGMILSAHWPIGTLPHRHIATLLIHNLLKTNKNSPIKIFVIPKFRYLCLPKKWG